MAAKTIPLDEPVSTRSDAHVDRIDGRSVEAY